MLMWRRYLESVQTCKRMGVVQKPMKLSKYPFSNAPILIIRQCSSQPLPIHYNFSKFTYFYSAMRVPMIIEVNFRIVISCSYLLKEHGEW